MFGQTEVALQRKEALPEEIEVVAREEEDGVEMRGVFGPYFFRGKINPKYFFSK